MQDKAKAELIIVLLASISTQYCGKFVFQNRCSNWKRQAIGNHEYWSGSRAFSEKMAILEKYKVKRLSGEMETITVNGETINLCGVDDPDAYMIADTDNNQSTDSFEEQLAHVKELSQNGHYTILISHRPELFDLYTSHGFDLVLCGHAHGGQWRMPRQTKVESYTPCRENFS